MNEVPQAGYLKKKRKINKKEIGGGDKR